MGISISGSGYTNNVFPDALRRSTRAPNSSDEDGMLGGRVRDVELIS